MVIRRVAISPPRCSRPIGRNSIRPSRRCWSPAGLAISGLFDLVPLVYTSVNDKLRMTEETAENASPIFWSRRLSGLKLIAAVGGSESSEYHRQSHDIAHAWHEDGLAVIPLELDGHNHFSVISGLADPDSLLTHSVVGLASSAS